MGVPADVGIDSLGVDVLAAFRFPDLVGSRDTAASALVFLLAFRLTTLRPQFEAQSLAHLGHAIGHQVALSGHVGLDGSDRYA